MGAAAIGADSVNPVAVTEHDPPGRGGVENAAADAAVPMAGLLEAGQIIHERGRGGDGDVPSLVPIERHDVIAADEHELFCAAVLVVITWGREPGFPSHWGS